MSVERWFLLALALGIVLLALRWQDRPIVHEPGVLVSRAPVQAEVDPVEFMKGSYSLTQRASFELRARVLGREDYQHDAGAALAPMDLALGWGPMSDQAIVDQIEVSQSGRWYHLRWSASPPLPESQIMGHSGNMHIIPANDFVLDALRDIREGQLVHLWGYLVDARQGDSYRWNTSLSRDDVGGGACELFYVERIVLE